MAILKLFGKILMRVNGLYFFYKNEAYLSYEPKCKVREFNFLTRIFRRNREIVQKLIVKIRKKSESCTEKDFKLNEKWQ